MKNKPYDFIGIAMRRSAQESGWSLDPWSLRRARKRLGKGLDNKIVGGAVTILLLAGVPFTITGGALIFAGGWLPKSLQNIATTVGFFIVLLPPVNGLVMALWRIQVALTRGQSFTIRYGTRPECLARASKLGWLLAIVTAVLVEVFGLHISPV